MAKYYGHDPIERNRIYDLAIQWLEDCLIHDGTLLWPSEAIWTLDNFQGFKRCFIDNPDDTSDSFEIKLQKQLALESSDVTRLACELLFIYFIFPSDTLGQTKVDLIRRVASWKGLDLPQTSNFNVLLENKGLGKPGVAFHTKRPFELAYLGNIGLEIKQYAPENRVSLFKNHKDFRAFIDKIKLIKNYVMRNIILHLLYPDYYERISSNSQKRLIYKEFKKTMTNLTLPADIDDALYLIRQDYVRKYPNKNIDFYSNPLYKVWNAGDADDNNSNDDKAKDSTNEDVTAVKEKQKVAVKSMDNNIILFGPPGTGKTYSVIDYALEIIDNNKYGGIIRNAGKREEAVKEYKELVRIGQIAFCTFHQSYGYEEFIEGLRSNDSGGFEPRDGILKTISNLARSSTKDIAALGYAFDESKINFFKMSLGNTLDGDESTFDYCLEKNVMGMGWGSDIDYKDCSDKKAIAKKYKSKYGDTEPFNIVAADRFKNRMKVGDIVFVSHGNTKLKAIARVTGNYEYNENTAIEFNHFRKVDWLYINREPMVPVKQILINKNFSQMTIYEHSKEDINFDSLRNFLSGEKRGRRRNYVLIIDEINRGNISKIFGELITLIEPDKRLDAENEITVTLPYSNDSFGVPQNLYIIGTMNTADRSIALMDTALRRRFNFIELSPDYLVLSANTDGINMQKMLQTINDRIEYLYDKDHLIGHAYFLDKHLTVQKLIAIMKTKVIPLLQEYFYQDWEKLELILGGAADDPAKQKDYLLLKTQLSPNAFFAGDLEFDQPDKTRYSIVVEPNEKALQRIYGDI